MNLTTLIGESWPDFGLIDSGHGRKLERYGQWRFIRPEPQAMWAPASTDWQAHGEFIPGSDEEGGGRWYLEDRGVPQSWELRWDDVRFHASCTPFRHLAFFPDMAPVWMWMRERTEQISHVAPLRRLTGRSLKSVHIIAYRHARHSSALTALEACAVPARVAASVVVRGHERDGTFNGERPRKEIRAREPVHVSTNRDAEEIQHCRGHVDD